MVYAWNEGKRGKAAQSSLYEKDFFCANFRMESGWIQDVSRKISSYSVVVTVHAQIMDRVWSLAGTVGQLLIVGLLDSISPSVYFIENPFPFEYVGVSKT